MEKKPFEVLSLAGKVAVVSGGASGIGLASAKRLAECGAAVVLLDIDEDAGRRSEAEIRTSGGKALFVRCDVRSDAACREAVGRAVADFGRIDILFNNAGVTVRKSVVGLTEGEWDLVADVMLKGTYLLSHYVIPHMVAAGGGSIINMGSGWAIRGGPDAAAYCAAKGGILNLTRAMAIDHGRHNIRVNCVCPGDVDTPLLRSECAQLRADEAAFLAEAARRPLARLGTPEDIADAVLFFASDMSRWVTGAFLAVDGGGTA